MSISIDDLINDPTPMSANNRLNGNMRRKVNT